MGPRVHWPTWELECETIGWDFFKLSFDTCEYWLHADACCIYFASWRVPFSRREKSAGHFHLPESRRSRQEIRLPCCREAKNFITSRSAMELAGEKTTASLFVNEKWWEVIAKMRWSDLMLQRALFGQENRALNQWEDLARIPGTEMTQRSPRNGWPSRMFGTVVTLLKKKICFFF